MVSKHDMGGVRADRHQACSDYPEGVDTVGAGARSAAGSEEIPQCITFLGKNIEEMSREELLSALRWCAARINDLYKDHMQTVAMMKQINRVL